MMEYGIWNMSFLLSFRHFYFCQTQYMAPVQTVIIFGADGMLGRYCCNYFETKEYEVIPITRKIFNITPQTHFTDELNTLFELYQINSSISPKPVVINCLGLIPQARPEGADDQEYLRVNGTFPNKLANLAKLAQVNLIHISTDCVFDGLTGNYVETDQPNETSIYGSSKSLGEPSRATVIRTSLIGEELYHTRSLLEWAKSKQNGQIQGYTNIYWNGITSLQLVICLEKIVAEQSFWSGVRHFFSPESISKYELLQLINQTYQLNLSIEPVELPISRNKCLQTNYLRPPSQPTQESYHIPSISTQIQALKSFQLRNLSIEVKVHFLAKSHHEPALSIKAALSECGIHISPPKKENPRFLFGGYNWKDGIQIPQLDYVLMIYNSLQHSIAWQRFLAGEKRGHTLAKARLIFSYEADDIELLEREFPQKKGQIFYLPFGYTPYHKQIYRPIDPDPVKDIDLFFYGRVSERRNRVIKRMREAGLKVIWPDVVLGEERNNLIARSKIVLNISGFEPELCGNFLARVSFLVSNQIFVIRERIGHQERQNALDQELCQYIISSENVDDLIQK